MSEVFQIKDPLSSPLRERLEAIEVDINGLSDEIDDMRRVIDGYARIQRIHDDCVYEIEEKLSYVYSRIHD